MLVMSSVGIGCIDGPKGKSARIGYLQCSLYHHADAETRKWRVVQLPSENALHEEH